MGGNLVTAEPISEVEQRSVPDWLIPPTEGFTTDYFLQMDGIPPHTELIDGSLVFGSPQRAEKRDRERKPQLYAKAGIHHYWRVELGDDARPAVYVYELDQSTGAYGLVGIQHDQLKVSNPFTIDIDLTEVDRL